MAEMQSGQRVGTDILHLQCQVDGAAISVSECGALLSKLSYMLDELHQHGGRVTVTEHQKNLEVLFGKYSGSAWPDFYMLRMTYGSPFDIWLTTLGVPKRIVQAVVTFLQFVTYHEETRQRLAARAAFETEKAEAERLKNVETVLRIAAGLERAAYAEPERVQQLLEFSRFIESGRSMKLTKVEFRVHQDL